MFLVKQRLAVNEYETFPQADPYQPVPDCAGSPGGYVPDRYHRAEEHWISVLQTRTSPHQVSLPLRVPVSQVTTDIG